MQGHFLDLLRGEILFRLWRRRATLILQIFSNPCQCTCQHDFDSAD